MERTKLKVSLMDQSWNGSGLAVSRRGAYVQQWIRTVYSDMIYSNIDSNSWRMDERLHTNMMAEYFYTYSNI